MQTLDASPPARLSVDQEAALAIAIARRLLPPMKVFTRELCHEMGRSSLSRRAVYSWERGESHVPAAALLAAARVSGISVDQLLRQVQRLRRFGLEPGQ